MQLDKLGEIETSNGKVRLMEIIGGTEAEFQKELYTILQKATEFDNILICGITYILLNMLTIKFRGKDK